MALPGVAGKLGDVAEKRGIDVSEVHRALADVWTTAVLVEQVAQDEGVQVLEATLNRAPAIGGGAVRPREVREKALVEYFECNGELPDFQAFAQEHGIKGTTVEGDVLRLMESARLPDHLLDLPEVQSWLVENIEGVIARCWNADNHGRLKPLFEWIEPRAPRGFDYTQLRIALGRRKAR